MSDDPRVAMDRMYRHQRHIYDLTRKFYLLGRDRLLRNLPILPGDAVCEVGCGTARNLVAIGRRHPGVELHGVDASMPMLETARLNIARARQGGRIQLHHGLAEELDASALLGPGRQFDLIVFAYSLSMIPDWRSAVDRAIANLRPGGSIAVVDFWDQQGLPDWFARSLQRWLALFDVHPRKDLVENFPRSGMKDLKAEPLFRGYAIELYCTKAA